MVETVIQAATRQAERDTDYMQGRTGPFEGVITSVQPDSDLQTVQYGPAPGRQMPIQHPFNGSTSWIRSIPDIQSRVLMQLRSDTGQAETLKTISPSTQSRVADYENALNAYRTLSGGEHDLVSSGLATLFMGHRGNLDARSGTGVKLQLNREAVEAKISAPTHVRTFLQNEPGTLGDEERFGIVKRWTSPIQETYPQQSGDFLAEHYRNLLNPANQGPEVLFQTIEGHVTDPSTGAQLLQTKTSLPLRLQHLYYDTIDNPYRKELDQNGNLYQEFPTEATEGYELNIQSGNYRSTMALNREVSIGIDELVTVGQNIQYTVQGDVMYEVDGDMNFTAGDAATVVDWSDTGMTFTFDDDNSLTIQDSLVSLKESGGAQLKIANGLVALGTSQVELVDIVIQLLQTITSDTYIGFGSPSDLSIAGAYEDLATQLLTIKGSI